MQVSIVRRIHYKYLLNSVLCILFQYQPLGYLFSFLSISGEILCYAFDSKV